MNDAERELYRRMIGVDDLPKALVDAHDTANLYRARLSEPRLSPEGMAILAAMAIDQILVEQQPERKEVDASEFEKLKPGAEVIVFKKGVEIKAEFVRFKKDLGVVLVKLPGKQRSTEHEIRNVKVING